MSGLFGSLSELGGLFSLVLHATLGPRKGCSGVGFFLANFQTDGLNKCQEDRSNRHCGGDTCEIKAVRSETGK